MKKQNIFLVFISILFFGCNTVSSDKTIDSDTLTSKNDSADTDITNDPNSKLPSENYDEIGFELLKSESIGELKIGLTALKTKQLIGEPEERSKAEEWEADGEIHQNWIYKKEGITLEMIGDSTSQLINTISIVAPCKFKTLKQIGIGSSKDEVLKGYDMAIDKSAGIADNILVGTVYGGLMFNMENEKVTSVFIGAMAE